MPSNISSPRYLPVLVVSLYGPRKEVTAQFASTRDGMGRRTPSPDPAADDDGAFS